MDGWDSLGSEVTLGGAFGCPCRARCFSPLSESGWPGEGGTNLAGARLVRAGMVPLSCRLHPLEENPREDFQFLWEVTVVGTI